MSVVSGGGFFNISITQVGAIGVNPGASLTGGQINFKCQYGNGSSINNFALLHVHTYNFAASTPQSIDLTSLLDQVGASISFGMVEFFAYRIQATNPAYVLTVGGAGSNPWNGFLVGAGQMVWQPSTTLNDGFMVLPAPNGMPVNSGSKILKMDPGTNAVGLVDLIIAGY
jgi:hypothetical protein